MLRINEVRAYFYMCIRNKNFSDPAQQGSIVIQEWRATLNTLQLNVPNYSFLRIQRFKHCVVSFVLKPSKVR